MIIRTLIIILLGIVLYNVNAFALENLLSHRKIESRKALLPSVFNRVVNVIQCDLLETQDGKTYVEGVDDNTFYVKLSFLLKNAVRQNDWQIMIKPAFSPSYHWAPHLTPTDKNIIDQHVFRSPALIMADSCQTIMLISDLDIMQKGTAVRWYMDMNAFSNELTLGMCKGHVSGYVLFERDLETIYPEGNIEIGFYLMYFDSKEVLENPFQEQLEFMWNRWGHKSYINGNPLDGDLKPYVEHTYNWAFNSWSKSVWQQFVLDGKIVGAPVFIVNFTQSSNFPGKVNERELRSIWNQALFNSLRSASGLYRHARRTGNKELLKKTNLTKEMALSFSQRDGFFYGLISTEMHT